MFNSNQIYIKSGFNIKLKSPGFELLYSKEAIVNLLKWILILFKVVLNLLRNSFCSFKLQIEDVKLLYNLWKDSTWIYYNILFIIYRENIIISKMFCFFFFFIKEQSKVAFYFDLWCSIILKLKCWFIKSIMESSYGTDEFIINKLNSNQA